MITKGQKIPSVTIKQATPEGGADVDPAALFAGKKVVMFSLPGAFTPICSTRHVPSFMERYPELRARDIDAWTDFCARHTGNPYLRARQPAP